MEKPSDLYTPPRRHAKANKHFKGVNRYDMRVYDVNNVIQCLKKIASISI